MNFASGYLGWKEMERNQLNPKEITLAIIAVVAGLLNAYLWRGLIFAGEFKNAAFYSLPIIALLVFAILFSLSSAFIRKRLVRAASAVLALAPGYIFVPFSPLVFGAAALTALGGWYASEQIANEYAASNYFSARKILKSGLPVFFTSIALLLAVFYFSTLGNQDSSALLPRALFDASIPLLEGPIQGILPGFRPDASVDQLILAFISRQTGEAVDLSLLPPAMRNQLLYEGRKGLNEQLGIKLTGKEKGSDVLYQAANAQIEKLAGPYKKYVPFIAAFGFFLAVKTLTLPAYWLTLILVALAVKLLVALGWLKQQTETVQIERIIL